MGVGTPKFPERTPLVGVTVKPSSIGDLVGLTCREFLGTVDGRGNGFSSETLALYKSLTYLLTYFNPSTAVSDTLRRLPRIPHSIIVFYLVGRFERASSAILFSSDGTNIGVGKNDHTILHDLRRRPVVHGYTETVMSLGLLSA